MGLLTEVNGWTPVIDALTKEFGLVTSAVYGVVWRYCQGEQRVCRASMETISEHIGIDRATVLRHIKKLCEAGYLKDMTPDLRNVPHTYADTGKAKIINLIEAQTVAQDNSLKRKRQTVAECTPTVAQDNKSVAENHLKKEEIEPKKEIPIEAEAAAYKKICNLYQREIGGLSGIVGDMIRDDVAIYPVEWIERAVGIAVKSNSRKWSYVEGILKNWKAIGGPQNDKPRGQKQPAANGHAKPAGTITGLQGRAIDDPIQKRCNIKTGETYWFDLRTNQRVPDPDGA